MPFLHLSLLGWPGKGRAFIYKKRLNELGFLSLAKCRLGNIYLLLTNTPEGSTRKREEPFEWKGSGGSRTRAYNFVRTTFQLEIRRWSWLSKKCISGIAFQEVLSWKKIPACFNAEVRQFFTDTIATSNSRKLGKIIQKVPLSPIFHHPHVSTSFSNLKFHTDGIQSPSSCQSYLVLLVLLTRSTHSWGLILSPGYFPACFVVEIGDNNLKPVSNVHMPHVSDYPPHLWGNGPKALGCLLHWDQLWSCPGWKEVWGATWAHHKWLSALKS